MPAGKRDAPGINVQPHHAPGMHAFDRDRALIRQRRLKMRVNPVAIV